MAANSGSSNPGARNDPWGAHYFSLEINGKEIAHFQEFSGMKTSSQVFLIEEGGYNAGAHARPGQSKWDNLVLKTATNVKMELLKWRDEFLQDKFSSRATNSGSIVMRDLNGSELRRFNFVNAFPVSWEGPQLSSDGSALSVETLEIAHEGIFLNAKPKPPPEPPPPEPIPEKLDLPPVQFKLDSAELTPKGKQTCKEAAEQLDNLEVQEIWIEGHTCTLGGWAHNLSLSDARANSVMEEVKAQSTKPRTYNAKGFSYAYPVAGNQSDSGRVANRRTDFMTTSWDARGRVPVQPDPDIPGPR